MLVYFGDRFFMRARDTDHLMSQFFHKRLQIERDGRLVFDDQHFGANLIGDFLAGCVDQSRGFFVGNVKRCATCVVSKPSSALSRKAMRGRSEIASIASRAAFVLREARLVNMRVDGIDPQTLRKACKARS